MSQTSDHYYTRLTAGIDPNDVQRWEQQIVDAERRRLHDKTVMDVIGSVTVPTTVVPEADSGTFDGDGGSLEWLQLALEMEEKQ
jgi:hypothetical protein